MYAADRVGESARAEMHARCLELLTWDPVCQRSVSFAERLGQPLHTVHYLSYRRPAIAPIKYVLQFVKTLRLLRSLRPAMTLVSNPPPFAALTAWLHHKIHGGHFAIDAHTGVFLEPKWRAFAPLNRFLIRRAAATIVTNEGLRDTISEWGGAPFVLPDRLPSLSTGGEFCFEPDTFNVAAIFSFYEDEPVAELLALRDLPAAMRIHVTGNSSRVPKRVKASLSPQMHLTGFLPRDKYDALVRGCDAVMVLCTRPHTMLCGAYEAAAAGKPLVTSESVAMRGEFTQGTIFVENTVAGITRGLAEVYARHELLTREMTELAAIMSVNWERRFAQCRSLLGDIARSVAGFSQPSNPIRTVPK